MPITEVTFGDETLSLAEAERRYRGGSLLWPLPFAFFKAAVEQSSPRNYVSPSQLKSCPRQFVLKQNTDYSIELETQEASLKGTAFHTMMEGAIHGEDDYLLEERVSRTLAVIVDGEPYDLTLSGQPDVYAKVYNAIEDYKTTGGYMRKDFDGYDSHKLQLHVYGWILRPRFPEISEARLYYLGNKQRVLIRFPLWPDEQVENLIADYAQEYIRWLRDSNYLPPIPTDPEMLRFCSTCPVRMACDAYDKEGVTRLG